MIVSGIAMPEGEFLKTFVLEDTKEAELFAKEAAGALTTEQKLQQLATKADELVPGQGTVSGTLKHTEFANQVKELNNPLLQTEVTYRNGNIVRYGTKGGVRLDVVEYNSDGTIKAVYDLKTGKAGLTDSRIKNIQNNLPNKAGVFEIRAKK